jgi:uncharacterized protein YkwD
VRNTVSLGSWRGALILCVVAAGVLWPKLQPRLDTALVRDSPACPHSSDFPSSNATVAGREEILCLLNVERAKVGLAALREEAHLDTAAQYQSDDIAMRHFFAHVDPDGRTPADRIAAAGYPPSPLTGENIAWGTESDGTPVRILDAWMHSPGHRANILRPQYTEIGIGITRGAPQAVQMRAAVYATTFGGGPLQPSVVPNSTQRY